MADLICHALRRAASVLPVKAIVTYTTSGSTALRAGPITRLKLLKRQMYDRAGIGLLRRRVRLAACSTQTAGEPRERGNFLP